MNKLLRAILVWFCLFISQSANADFNRTYTLAGKRLTGTSTAILDPNSRRDLVVCSAVLDTPGVSYNSCSLLKLDSNGNIITGIYRNSGQGPERVIETRDSGVLLVSFWDDHTEITKFNTFLGVVWTIDVPHTSTVGVVVSNGFTWDIDIEKTIENDMENYYIVYSVGNSNFPQDMDISVLKLMENGTMVWHKQYYDNSRGSFGGIWSAQRHFTNAITSYPDPNDQNQRYFVVGGHCWNEDDYAVQSTNLFALTIDNSGNIVKQYQRLQSGDIVPDAPDMIWDGDSLVITYVEENGGNFNPSTASGIGLIKCDVGFNAFRGKYFYHACENYGMSITIPSDGNYMIGGWISECYWPYTWAATPYFLKLDRNNLNELYFTRYNTSDGVGYASYHRTDNIDANYSLAQVNHSYGPGLANGDDVRVIKTDAFGNVCGEHDFDITVEDFEPGTDELEYTSTDLFDMSNAEPAWYNVTYTDKNCNDGSVHKNTPATLHNLNAAIIPTVVRKGIDNNLECTVTAGEASILNMQVVNVLGQVVYENSYKVVNGTNHFSIDTDVLANGINVIRIARGNELVEVTKVMVMN